LRKRVRRRLPAARTRFRVGDLHVRGAIRFATPYHRGRTATRMANAALLHGKQHSAATKNHPGGRLDQPGHGVINLLVARSLACNETDGSSRTARQSLRR